MRIAYVLDQLLPNTEADTEQAMNTAAALVHHGADLTLHLPRPVIRPGVTANILRGHYKIDEELPIREFRLPLVGLRSIAKAFHPLRVIASRTLRKADVVYTRNFPTVACALATGHKVVYETYRPWPTQHPSMTRAFRWAMNHDNFLGAVLHSQFAKDSYLNIDVAEDRLYVAHNGYRPGNFKPRLSKSEARSQLGLPKDRPIVTYSGRINLNKGFGIVLEMAAANPDVHFLLVGSQGQGEVENKAKDMENVQIEGWMQFDRIAPYLYAADVLLVPPSLGPLQKANNTVLPIKLFSYLAAGRPILAPEAPDTAEILQHSRNAYLVEADNLDVANRGLRALINDPDVASRLGQTCSDLAADLTWDARGQRLMDFMQGRLALT